MSLCVRNEFLSLSLSLSLSLCRASVNTESKKRGGQSAEIVGGQKGVGVKRGGVKMSRREMRGVKILEVQEGERGKC